MKRTKLIQRLRAPSEKSGVFKDKDNPFAFGGGYKNGGLDEQAMALIRPLFDFDYMGAAEFEFGALPKAINKMIEYQKSDGGGLVLKTVTFNSEDIKIPEYRSHRTTRISPPQELKAYVVCSKADAAEILRRAKTILCDENKEGQDLDGEIWLKERFGLGEYMATTGHTGVELIGGLELDNGFLITSKKEIAEKFLKLFFHPKTQPKDK